MPQRQPTPKLPPNERRLAEGGQRVAQASTSLTGASDFAPEISIVTPVYNGERYLRRCLDSIASQQYRRFEHIVIDGGSTDSTVDILREYDNCIDYWVSEPDQGMYDAIAKGFSLAQGSIFAWINADDRYYPWSLDIVAQVFAEKPNIHWLTGIPTTIDDKDRLISVQIPKIYFRKLIALGYYRGDILECIQQESTFFRSELYHQTGLSTNLRLAGDYDLWTRMASYAPLHTIKTVLASFRRHPDQQSTDIDRYLEECDRLRRPRHRYLKYLVLPISVLLEHRMTKVR
jgi:hypothetical protein